MHMDPTVYFTRGLQNLVKYAAKSKLNILVMWKKITLSNYTTTLKIQL
jgi:hypothetical protein